MNETMIILSSAGIAALSAVAVVPLWNKCEQRKRRLKKERKAAAKEVNTEKPTTEKERFIVAYMAAFNSDYETAKHAYKTSDTATRKVLIDLHERKGR